MSFFLSLPLLLPFSLFRRRATCNAMYVILFVADCICAGLPTVAIGNSLAPEDLPVAISHSNFWVKLALIDLERRMTSIFFYLFF